MEAKGQPDPEVHPTLPSPPAERGVVGSDGAAAERDAVGGEAVAPHGVGPEVHPTLPSPPAERGVVGGDAVAPHGVGPGVHPTLPSPPAERVSLGSGAQLDLATSGGAGTVLAAQVHQERELKFSRRSILWAAGYLAATYGGVKWFASRAEVAGTPWPFRRGLELNEGFWGDAFDPDKPVRTFSKSAITESRENGDEGLTDDFDPDAWHLAVEGVSGEDGPIKLTMEDIRKLPEFEMTTEFFCIEGWSIIQHWKGVRFRDFMRKYPPATVSGDEPDVDKKPKDLPPYVGMMTPDGGYYVGLDMPSARHVQTMLCYEMNGEPLTLEHGAPLRLVIPVKYGVKNIKRIGKITYTDKRPRDFWAEQGYDWFAGL